VVIVGPPDEAAPIAEEELDRLLRGAMENLSVKDAAAAVSAQTGAPRRLVYARALTLAGLRR
jgi:16S rRNA (cytidine1402-2'-O)-methyltransferase